MRTTPPSQKSCDTPLVLAPRSTLLKRLPCAKGAPALAGEGLSLLSF